MPFNVYPCGTVARMVTSPHCQAQIYEKHFGDLLDSIDPESVDLILTDPPYAISKSSGFSNGALKKFTSYSTDFGSWDNAEIDLDELCCKSYSALRRGGTVVIWYDHWKVTRLRDALERAGFRMLRLILWEKTNPVPVNSKRFYLSNSREIAVAGVKVGKPTFNGSYHNGSFSYPIPRHYGNRIHPTQKHDALFAELVRLHSNPGDLVVDPFLGGGTTAAACQKLRRNFIGGDIDPTYVQRVRDRLSV